MWLEVLRKPSASVIVCGMRDLLLLIAHLIITAIRIIAPGGARAVIAESLLLKHQLMVLNRARKKAPRLRALDRVLLCLGAILVSPLPITLFQSLEAKGHPLSRMRPFDADSPIWAEGLSVQAECASISISGK